MHLFFWGTQTGVSIEVASVQLLHIDWASHHLGKAWSMAAQVLSSTPLGTHVFETNDHTGVADEVAEMHEIQDFVWLSHFGNALLIAAHVTSEDAAAVQE